jgi:hypothetical protein
MTLGTSYLTGRTLADAKSKKEAVALAAVMVGDGRMPTQEEARREAAERTAPSGKSGQGGALRSVIILPSGDNRRSQPRRRRRSLTVRQCGEYRFPS